MTENSDALPGFEALGLPPTLLSLISNLGWQTPTPIQRLTIPALLEGRDVVGQAQTGTGKTGAFALPLIARVDAADTRTQVLVLAPTRELAQQTAAACEALSKAVPGLRVQSIVGGREYGEQIRGLKRGAQIVVGTPGRIIDHMEKKTLDVSAVSALVLDEADEMLRMGFIEDVEQVLAETPSTRQALLFSATLPEEIRRVAKKYLRDPLEISLETRSRAASTISQCYVTVDSAHKTELLLRILEVESPEGVIVFTRTKADSVTVAEDLAKAGVRAEALNGDLPQAKREQIVERLKNGTLDVVAATDVAARGLDVERISHVVNFDPPHDPEAYVHRIGRTGRAGREGRAILMLSPRDRMTLRILERATGQKIAPLSLPTLEVFNAGRIGRFKQRIVEASAGEHVDEYKKIVSDLLAADENLSAVDVAAALAAMLSNGPLLLNRLPKTYSAEQRELRERSGRKTQRELKPRGRSAGPRSRAPRQEESPMDRYRVQVGASHGLKPSNLVGAIANEADLSSKYIGRIEIYHAHATVDLPVGMPKEIFHLLSKVRVCNRPLNLQRMA